MPLFDDLTHLFKLGDRSDKMRDELFYDEHGTAPDDTTSIGTDGATTEVIVTPGAECVTRTFDYAGYDETVVAELRAAAIEIRARGQGQNAAIYAIGVALLGVKDKVGHGNWGRWLDAEFEMSVSTAERYMRVATRFDGKFLTVTNLHPSTLYLMAAKSTPGEVFDVIVDELSAGTTLTNESIATRVREAKEGKRVEKEAKAREQRKQQRKEEAREHKARQTWVQQQEAAGEARGMAEAEKILEILADFLGEQFPAVASRIERVNAAYLQAALRKRVGVTFGSGARNSSIAHAIDDSAVAERGAG